MAGAERFKPPSFLRNKEHGVYLRGLDRDGVQDYYDTTYQEDSIPLNVARQTVFDLALVAIDPELESSGPYLPNIPFGD